MRAITTDNRLSVIDNTDYADSMHKLAAEKIYRPLCVFFVEQEGIFLCTQCETLNQ